jgi:hypothetical protein
MPTANLRFLKIHVASLKEEEVKVMLQATSSEAGELDLQVVRALGMTHAQTAMLALTNKLPRQVAPTPVMKRVYGPPPPPLHPLC